MLQHDMGSTGRLLHGVMLKHNLRGHGATALRRKASGRRRAAFVVTPLVALPLGVVAVLDPSSRCPKQRRRRKHSSSRSSTGCFVRLRRLECAAAALRGAGGFRARFGRSLAGSSKHHRGVLRLPGVGQPGRPAPSAIWNIRRMCSWQVKTSTWWPAAAKSRSTAAAASARSAVEIHQHVVQHQRQRGAPPGVTGRQRQPQAEEELLAGAAAEGLDRQRLPLGVVHAQHVLAQRRPDAADSGPASAAASSRRPLARSPAAAAARNVARITSSVRQVTASTCQRRTASSSRCWTTARSSCFRASWRSSASVFNCSASWPRRSKRCLQLLVGGGRGGEQFIAAGFQRRRPRRPSSCRRTASCGQWPAMAAVISRSTSSRSRREHVGAGGLDGAAAKFLLVAGARLAQQLPAAAPQPAHGLFMLGARWRPICRNCSRMASRRASDRLLPAERLGQAGGVARRASPAPTADPRCRPTSCTIRPVRLSNSRRRWASSSLRWANCR